VYRVFVLGIPRCNEPADIFAETLAAAQASESLPAHTIIIDNGDAPLEVDVGNAMVIRPPTNAGCAGAWNIVLRYAYGVLNAGTVILLNGDCAVGRETLTRMLRSPAGVVCAQGYSCFRLDEPVWRFVGEFDEGFWPVYWEDTDYRRRLALAGVDVEEWVVQEVARPSQGRATYASGITHGKSELGGYQGWSGERLAQFQARLAANQARYVEKWGGLPSAETLVTPFGALEGERR
jgi:Glycosyl transferase family 2